MFFRPSQLKILFMKHPPITFTAIHSPPFPQLISPFYVLLLQGNKNPWRLAEGGLNIKTKPLTFSMYSVDKNVKNPNSKIQCDTCQKDITKHVKMMDIASQLLYCVPCFCKLDPLPNEYHVLNKLNFALFETEWSAEEELLLFQGLKRFGFGNWKQISQSLGTKTADQVQCHYQKIYLSNSNYIPDQKQLVSKRDQKSKRFRAPPAQKKKNQIKQEKTYKNNLRLEKQKLSVTQPHANASEIVGYMPLRGQFQIQYDNDAELLLAQMQFNDDDTQQQKQIKKKLLQIYNLRIDERIKRKKFVIERELLDFKKQCELDKKRSKEEKEIYNMMKAFARFNTPEDHQKLIQGLIQEKKIRQRIQQLKKYRLMGLKTFADVQQFIEKKLSKSDERFKKQRPSQNFVWQNKGVNPRRPRAAVQSVKTQKKGSNVLTDQEQKLCDSLQLSPYHYLIIKETLVRESLREGFIKKDETENIFKIDKRKVFRVYDYLLSIKKIEGQKK